MGALTATPLIERVGARVRAVSSADAAHTARGIVEHLPDVAPVALVRFHCGCRSYVPLRRLVIDDGPLIPACEFTGCTSPRWEGPYCPSHRTRASRKLDLPTPINGQPFEPKAEPRATHPSAGNGAIDGAGTPPSGEAPMARPSSPGGRARAVRRATNAPYWTRERIISAIQVWAASHDGEPPKVNDWHHACPNGTHPQFKTVVTEFGTWNGGIAAAGFTPRVPHGKRYSDDDILAAIRRWNETYGRPPTAADWSPSRARRQGDEEMVRRYLEGDWPSFGVVINHFGTWNAALAAAGFEPHPFGRRTERAA